MTWHRARNSGQRRKLVRGQHARGQSLVEFALVVPIMVFLLVAVADFGRVFATGLTLEAAVRDAAEVASNDYLANPPGATATPPVPLTDPAPVGDPAYYGTIHQRIARTICAETSELPNSNFDSVTGDCVGMPLIMACIHDSQDTHCGNEAYAQPIPGECTTMSAPPTNAQLSGPSGEKPRYVEVRTCYRFDAIVDLPGMPFTEVWLQRSRMFTIPCYYATGTAECG
jgi:hypothetical protein